MNTSNQPDDSPTPSEQQPSMESVNATPMFVTGLIDLSAIQFPQRSAEGRFRDGLYYSSPETKPLLDRIEKVLLDISEVLNPYLRDRPAEDADCNWARTKVDELMETVQMLVNHRHEMLERLLPEASRLNLPRWTREVADLGSAILAFEAAYARSGIQDAERHLIFRLPEELRYLLLAVNDRADAKGALPDEAPHKSW